MPIRCMSLALVLGIAATPARAEVIAVGPGHALKLPSEAAGIAQDGDVIAIEAGDYHGDVAVWRQDSLTLRGVGGMARLISGGKVAQGKAIWVIKGKDTAVEYIEFNGARARHKNGAGIRQEGPGLVVRHSRFVDNENGILAGHDPQSEILIEHSEFSGNGAGDGRSHNMYIGRVRSFTLQYSYSHHARVGHQVKTRAQENYILFNRLMDERDGNSSYLIDVAEGGLAYIVGNVLAQGKRAENHAFVNYHPTKGNNPLQGLYVVNNTFVNDRRNGVFVINRNQHVEARIINNLFVGKGSMLNGAGKLLGNLQTSSPEFANPEQYDFRLRGSSPAVNAGREPGLGHGFELRPLFEYGHVAEKRARAIDRTIDVGAHEYAQ